MKRILVVGLCLFSCVVSIGKVLDASRLTAKTRIEVKELLDVASQKLLENISSQKWAEVYSFVSSDFQAKTSKDDFVSACDHLGSTPTISQVFKVIIVEDRESDTVIYAQCIYSEVFSGVTAYKAITWRLNLSDKNRKWEVLNLAFERFIFLPMEMRYRF